MFFWQRNGQRKQIEEDLENLDSRVSNLEREMLPLLRTIDKRTSLLENHMSHIVESAFGKEKRDTSDGEVGVG